MLLLCLVLLLHLFLRFLQYLPELLLQIDRAGHGQDYPVTDGDMTGHGAVDIAKLENHIAGTDEDIGHIAVAVIELRRNVDLEFLLLLVVIALFSHGKTFI